MGLQALKKRLSKIRSPVPTATMVIKYPWLPDQLEPDIVLNNVVVVEDSSLNFDHNKF